MEIKTKFNIGDRVRVIGRKVDYQTKTLSLRVQGVYADKSGWYYFLVLHDAPEIPEEGMYMREKNVIKGD